MGYVSIQSEEHELLLLLWLYERWINYDYSLNFLLRFYPSSIHYKNPTSDLFFHNKNNFSSFYLTLIFPFFYIKKAFRIYFSIIF